MPLQNPRNPLDQLAYDQEQEALNLAGQRATKQVPAPDLSAADVQDVPVPPAPVQKKAKSNGVPAGWVPISDEEAKKIEAKVPKDWTPISDEEAARIDATAGAKPNQMSSAMDPKTYRATFIANNPQATPEAIDMAMKQFDVDKAARGKAKVQSVQDRFEVMKDPNKAFDERLNKKLQAKSKGGIVPVLHGRLQPAAPAPANPADSDALDVAGESLKSGTVGAVSSLARAPGAVADVVEGMLASVNELGRDLGLPEWMLERKYVQPLQILNPILSGLTVGDKHFGGTNDLSKAIKDFGGRVENQQHAAAIKQLGTTANTALDSAIQTGDIKPIVNVLSDPKAWAGAFGQAAPSLVVAMFGGVPAMAALEGGSAAEKVDQFKAQGGNVNSMQAASAIVQQTVINTMLEKLGLDAMLGKLPPAVREKIIGQSLTGLKARVATGAVVGGVGEAGTEALQSVNENLAARNYNPNQSLTEDVLTSAMGGFAPGSAMGGVSGAMHKVAAPTMVEPIPANVVPPAPQTGGPLTSAVASAAPPERVVVATPNGPVAGSMVAYEEDSDGNFIARIVDDNGQVLTLTEQDGLQIAPVEAEAPGTLTAALESAADDHAVAHAAPNEQVQAELEALKPPPPPEPVPAPSPEETYANMDLAALRERLKYIAQQAKQSGMNKMFMDDRRAVEKAIGQKTKEAKEASKLAEEPITSGPFKDMAAANKMALRVAEKSGVPQEVYGTEGKFKIKPIEGEVDAVPSAGETGDVRPAAVPDAQPRTAVTADEPRADVPAAAVDAGGAKPAAVKKDLHQKARFGDPAKAEAYIVKHKLQKTHRVEQTGRVRYELKLRDAEPNAGGRKKALDAEAKLNDQIAAANEKAAARAAPAPASDIDAQAHEAATSPTNDLPEPTEAQAEAGNYKKGHVAVHGLDITIENPRGSERSGKRLDGSTWSHMMSDHYGYIKRTVGADDEQVDVYVGAKPDSDQVFVIDQLDQASGGFDEHKAMLGFKTKAAAMRAYKSNFDKGWKVGPVKAMSIDEFKAWLKDGDTTKPAAEAAPGKSVAQIDKEFRDRDRSAGADSLRSENERAIHGAGAEAASKGESRTPPAFLTGRSKDLWLGGYDAAEKVPDVAPEPEQQAAPGVPAATAGSTQPEPVAAPEPEATAEPDVDDGADIPKAFYKKIKVPFDVWVVEDAKYETIELEASEALASVREDIVNLRSLLDCMKG